MVSVTHSQPQSKTIKWKKSRNKQYVHFKWHAVLGSAMKSLTILLCPTQNGNRPYVQGVHVVPSAGPLVTE